MFRNLVPNRLVNNLPNKTMILRSSFLQDMPQYNNHLGVFMRKSKVNHNILYGVAIHNVNRGPGQGGVRLLNYDNVGNFMDDMLRLSRGMSYKNSAAGLWWGGAKACITYDESLNDTYPY